VKIFLGNDGSAPVEKIGPYAYDLHDFCCANRRWRIGCFKTLMLYTLTFH